MLEAPKKAVPLRLRDRPDRRERRGSRLLLLKSTPLAFIARRLVYGVVVVFSVLTIVFLITHAIGDPAELALPADAPVAQVDALRRTLGLDQPLWVQYRDSVWDWLRGDFGQSTATGAAALPLALNALAKTLYLAAVTCVISIPLALILGVIAGLRPGSLIDRLVAVIAALGISVASFWLGLMLILLFAVNLHWLPSNGYGGATYVLLPAIALSVKPLGRLAQMTRASVSEELGKDYVKAGRARGLSESRLAVAHIAKNAAAPVLTLIGDEIASLMNGAIVIETVFGWPGIGRLLIQSIGTRDLPVIVACVAVIAAVVIVINLLVDIAYPVLDPRIRN